MDVVWHEAGGCDTDAPEGELGHGGHPDRSRDSRFKAGDLRVRPN